MQELLRLIRELKESQVKNAKHFRQHRKQVAKNMMGIEQAVADLSRNVTGLRGELDQFAASQETQDDYLTRLAVAMNALVDDHVKLEARVTRLEQKPA